MVMAQGRARAIGSIMVAPAGDQAGSHDLDGGEEAVDLPAQGGGLA